MQPAPIFLRLRQIPAGCIHFFHAIAEFAHGAEHFIIDKLHIIQSRQRCDGVGFHIGIMGESRQNAGIGAHRHGYGGGVGEPGVGGLMIFGCGPATLLGASRMVFVQHDLEMVALIAGESAGGKPHYRNGIPFQPFGLVYGHQFHIHRSVGETGGFILHRSQMIHPCDEPMQRGSLLSGNLLRVRIHQIHNRIHRHMRQSGIGAVLRIMQHTGQYGVDVKIQRFYAGANHVAQWSPDGIMHLTEHHRGPGYGVAPVCAQPFKQFYQVAA